ncbi:hypothetical protein OKJ99_20005 [Streptomyces endophyticus]|uniref:Uncharacterized protein n=1 Tax=Streptomyces endophyticus TaxID=714166 RepID=A0ABU6FAF6_9ACTN|nr:hypothetical protein [Streptomyces endophyticus]MEB8339777.1 hypothetical protein [Streptomyces endophyticus]
MLPADGGEPLLPGTYGDQAGPAGASPWGQPWGPESQQAHNAGPMPTYDGAMPTYEWGQPQGSAPMPPAPPHDAGALPPQSYGAALPQQQPAQALPQQQPAQALPQQYAEAGPLPPAAPAGPAAGAYDGDATQYIPPAAQQQAAQYAAGPGLPPEAPAPDATQFLGRAQPMPDAAPPGYGGSSDSEATQYIPPVPGQPMPGQPMPGQPMPGQAMPAQDQGYGARPGAPGERQPPAEFDALFRTEPEGGAAATQQMPRFDPYAAQAGPGGPGAPGMTPPPQQYGYEPEPPRRGKARTGSKVPLVVAVGVAILVVGVGAGAMLSGGDDDKKTDATKNVSNSGPASESPSPSVDPAKAQAVELDKLLGDSNNSRSAVVRSVANIGGCKALPQASKDLRSAATQRNDLVTRLGTLSVDKLPDNARLTAALTSAWKASASADSHYAKWGDQVAGKKHALCKKGHAKPTPERRAGDAASGTASTQKQQASKLWNQIASKYGLTQRSAVQL